MSKEHEHEYKEVVYKVQEAKIGHWNYADHLITILNHEKVKLFCITCGSVLDAEGVVVGATSGENNGSSKLAKEGST